MIVVTTGALVIDKAINLSGTVGNILLKAAGDVTGRDAVTSSTGNISLDAGGGIGQATATADITASAAGKTIDLKAATSITMVDGAASSSNNGLSAMRRLRGISPWVN